MLTDFRSHVVRTATHFVLLCFIHFLSETVPLFIFFDCFQVDTQLSSFLLSHWWLVLIIVLFLLFYLFYYHFLLWMSQKFRVNVSSLSTSGPYVAILLLPFVWLSHCPIVFKCTLHFPVSFWFIDDNFS